MEATLTRPPIKLAAKPAVKRTNVMFCVLPADLGHHFDALRHMYHGSKHVAIVVERRTPNGRRFLNLGAPGGVERRSGDRRDQIEGQTAAEIGLALPRQMRREAHRVICATRAVPVGAQDIKTEADQLLAASGLNGIARCELRLRYHSHVYGTVAARATTPERALDLTDRIFDDLFANHETDNFTWEISRATWRVLSNRPRRGPH